MRFTKSFDTSLVGADVGKAVSVAVCPFDGESVGAVVGPLDGKSVGAAVGLLDGESVGVAVGPLDGESVGAAVGPLDGESVGVAAGPVDGESVGVVVNGVIGVIVGPLDGELVGETVGENVCGIVSSACVDPSPSKNGAFSASSPIRLPSMMHGELSFLPAPFPLSPFPPFPCVMHGSLPFPPFPVVLNIRVSDRFCSCMQVMNEMTNE